MDFILTHRNVCEERGENLEYVLGWINSLEVDSNIIVVEQDDTSKLKIDFSKYNTKHIFAKNDGLFNKSWGMNIGIRNSSSDHIVFCDSDCFLETYKMNRFLEDFQHGNYDYGSPNMKCHMTDESDRKLLMNSSYHTEIKCQRPPTTAPTIFPLTGGVFCSKRTSINRIKWWDENFRGWGKEDNAMTIKFRSFDMSPLEGDHMLYHLWHPVYYISGYKSKNVVNENLLKLQKNYSNKIITKRYLNGLNTNLMGDVNKYS